MKNLTALTWNWQQECDDILGMPVFVLQQKLADPNFITQTDGQTGRRRKSFSVNVTQLANSTLKPRKACWDYLFESYVQQKQERW